MVELATVTELHPPDEIAERINAEHRLAASNEATALEHKIKCGEMLLQQKAITKHGQWKPWVKQHCEFEYSTATIYMDMARKKLTGVNFSSVGESRRQRRAAKATKPPRYSWRTDARDLGLVTDRSGGPANELKIQLEADHPGINLNDQAQTHAALLEVKGRRNPENVDAEISEIRSTVKENAKAKFDRALRAAVALQVGRLQAEMKIAIEAAVAEKNTELETKRKTLNDWDAELRAEREAVQQLRATIDTYMTQDEYRLVLSCLHPDQQERTAERLSKAFAIFKRLESMVNPKTPISVLRERGWDRVSPFFKG